MSVTTSAPIRRSLTRALIAILCAGVLLVLILLGLLPFDGPSRWVLLLFPINVALYLGSGVLAWYHRPSSRMGALILLTGLWVFLAGLGNTDVPLLATLGLIAQSLPLAGLVHLLLAFPTGRVHGRAARATVALGYANSLLLQAPSYLFARDPALPHLLMAEVPNLVQLANFAQEAVGFVVLLISLALLTYRLRRASATERRVLLPLYGYGIAVVLTFLFASRILRPYFGWSALDVAAVQLLLFCGIPLAFALGALRGGIARTGELEELGVWLGEAQHTKPEIGQALARTLGDPTLQIWFWTPHSDRYVDVEGNEVSDSRVTDHGIEPIELDGRRIGVISYDVVALPEPDLVRTAGRVVAIALDRERLVAELRASHRALRSSRERLVEVADHERRRIAQDLHDGLQVQMVLLALEAQQLANSDAAADDVHERATELRHGIDTAAASLREVVHAVMPAALTQRGLSAAAEDLVDRMPVPTSLTLGVVDGDCSPVVESTAYFVVAEALANAVKHSRAGAIDVGLIRAGDVLHVEVRDNGDGGAVAGRGSGLTGMRERVDALGGTVHIESESGRGTMIRAEIPCGL